MAWYPKARRRQLPRNYTARRTNKNCALLHSTASIAASQFGWFSDSRAQASSHFHIDFSGNVEQYLDTDFIAWTNVDGNPRSVTIETAGIGNEVWSAAQVRAIVDLLIWICDTHRIPVRQMASSRTTEHGIGWHRLGIDGNFPTTGILRGRLQRGGGEYWDRNRGKVCPGSLRIQQIPGIIRQVQNRAVTPAAPKEKPLSLTQANIDAIAQRVMTTPIRSGFSGNNVMAQTAIRQTQEALTNGRVFRNTIPSGISDNNVMVQTAIRQTQQRADKAARQTDEIKAMVTSGITALADQLDSLKPGLAAAVKEAVAEAAEEVRREQVEISAQEVAEELEVTARAAQEDEEQDEEEES